MTANRGRPSAPTGSCAREQEKVHAVHLPERRACRKRHYSSLPCRRVEGTSAASGATGHRRNSAGSSPPPGATGCSRATARMSAGWITSATSGTLTTLTRSSSAVAVSSRGGGVSSPSVRWRTLGDGRGRLCCAAPAPSDTRAASAASVAGSISLDGSRHWLQALGERSPTLSAIVSACRLLLELRQRPRPWARGKRGANTGSNPVWAFQGRMAEPIWFEKCGSGVPRPPRKRV
jgi:hypothetical protein